MNVSARSMAELRSVVGNLYVHGGGAKALKLFRTFPALIAWSSSCCVGCQSCGPAWQAGKGSYSFDSFQD